jgi:hypothetical protein
MERLYPKLPILPAIFLCIFAATVARSENSECKDFVRPEWKWTQDEQTLWLELCAGNIDERISSSRSKTLSLGRYYLKEIFNSSEATNALPKGPILISSAAFTHGLDLTNITVNFPLAFEDVNFGGVSDFSSSIFFGAVSILRGQFDTLLAKDALFKASFTLGNFNGSYQLPIDELTPTIGNRIDLSDSSFSRDLIVANLKLGNDMVAINITSGNSISLDRIHAKRLKLANAVASQEIDIIDSYFEIEPDPKRRPAINLFSAKSSKIIIRKDTIEAKNLEDNSLLLQAANIETGIYILDTDFCIINAEDIVAKMTLSIAYEEVIPVCKTSLNIRNSTIQMLSVPLHTLSQKSNDLYGSKIDDLDPNMLEKDGKQNETLLRQWLSTSQPYSPEPYEKVGKLLGGMGYQDLSQSVYYANRERQLKTAWEGGEYIQAAVLAGYWAFVGYGLRPQRVLIWVFVLVGVGAVVLKYSRVEFDDPRLGPIITSLDMLLPVISIDDSKKEMPEPGLARTYLYVHKAMGYLLSTYLLAAFGLGK